MVYDFVPELVLGIDLMHSGVLVMVLGIDLGSLEVLVLFQSSAEGRKDASRKSTNKSLREASKSLKTLAVMKWISLSRTLLSILNT